MTSTFLNRCSAISTGKNLSEFLNFYGNYFDPKKTSLNGTEFISINGLQSDVMIVIDPLNPSNNTARNAFRIGEI